MNSVPKRGYTPGPWALSDSQTNIRLLTKRTSASATIAVLCGFPQKRTKKGREAEANARLIAAAPDLYEALSAIEDYILSEADFPPKSFNAALRNTAKEALNKVRGEVDGY